MAKSLFLFSRKTLRPRGLCWSYFKGVNFLETELRVKPLFNPSRDVRGLWHRAPSSCPCPRKIISCFQFYIEYHLMLLRPPGTHIAREKNYFLLHIWLPSASSLGVPPPQQVHRTSSLSDVAAPSTQCKTDSLCLRAASRARTFQARSWQGAGKELADGWRAAGQSG